MLYKDLGSSVGDLVESVMRAFSRHVSIITDSVIIERPVRSVTESLITEQRAVAREQPFLAPRCPMGQNRVVPLTLGQGGTREPRRPGPGGRPECRARAV